MSDCVTPTGFGCCDQVVRCGSVLAIGMATQAGDCVAGPGTGCSIFRSSEYVLEDPFGGVRTETVVYDELPLNGPPRRTITGAAVDPTSGTLTSEAVAETFWRIIVSGPGGDYTYTFTLFDQIDPSDVLGHAFVLANTPVIANPALIGTAHVATYRADGMIVVNQTTAPANGDCRDSAAALVFAFRAKLNRAGGGLFGAANTPSSGGFSAEVRRAYVESPAGWCIFKATVGGGNSCFLDDNPIVECGPLGQISSGASQFVGIVEPDDQENQVKFFRCHNGATAVAPNRNLPVCA